MKMQLHSILESKAILDLGWESRVFDFHVSVVKEEFLFFNLPSIWFKYLANPTFMILKHFRSVCL